MDRVLVILAIVAALALIGLSLLMPNPAPGALQREAQFTLTKNAIDPERIVLQHGRVKLVVTNRDTVLHQIEVFDPVENRTVAQLTHLRPQQTQALWVDLSGGGIGERRYQIYDPLFRQKGMEAVIIVR